MLSSNQVLVNYLAGPERGQTEERGQNRRLEFELGAWCEELCGFALVLALSQMMGHGLGPWRSPKSKVQSPKLGWGRSQDSCQPRRASSSAMMQLAARARSSEGTAASRAAWTTCRADFLYDPISRLSDAADQFSRNARITLQSMTTAIIGVPCGTTFAAPQRVGWTCHPAHPPVHPRRLARIPAPLRPSRALPGPANRHG